MSNEILETLFLYQTLSHDNIKLAFKKGKALDVLCEGQILNHEEIDYLLGKNRGSMLVAYNLRLFQWDYMTERQRRVLIRLLE